MSQVMTGARGVLEINGKTVGIAGGINITVEHTLADVDLCGQLDVADLAETGHKCNFTVNYFKFINGSGTVPTNGYQPAVELGLESGSIADMMSRGYIKVRIVDSMDQSKELVVLENCKLEGGSGQMDARGVWQGTWNFRAKKCVGWL